MQQRLNLQVTMNYVHLRIGAALLTCKGHGETGGDRSTRWCVV